MQAPRRSHVVRGSIGEGSQSLVRLSRVGGGLKMSALSPPREPGVAFSGPSPAQLRSTAAMPFPIQAAGAELLK